MTQTYQRIVLASRPQGSVTSENFRLERVPVPTSGPGQVLVRNQFLSLDPYMRGRMEESKSYADPQPLGETMIGGTAGVVETSQNPAFAPGDAVAPFGRYTEPPRGDLSATYAGRDPTAAGRGGRGSVRRGAARRAHHQVEQRDAGRHGIGPSTQRR